jgi:ABC-type antimicrobial peptide transport system permease subunit
VAVGGLAAFELTRLMGYLLYKVSPHDPVAFSSAIAVVFCAALIACIVPAWRATRTDPIQALRG